MYVGKLSPSKECFLPAWRCSSIQQFTACNTDPVLRKWDPGLLQKHAHIHTYTHTCITHMYIYKYMRAYTAMYIYTCIQVHALTNTREHKAALSSLTDQTLPRRSLSKMSVHWYRESGFFHFHHRWLLPLSRRHFPFICLIPQNRTLPTSSVLFWSQWFSIHIWSRSFVLYR